MPKQIACLLNNSGNASSMLQKMPVEVLCERTAGSGRIQKAEDDDGFIAGSNCSPELLDDAMR